MRESVGGRTPSAVAPPAPRWRRWSARGIHYGPWRPGTGPNKNYPYPSLQGIAEDFEVIRGVHANTVLLYDAPGEALDVAERYGLKVVYVFALDWYSIGGADQPAITARIVKRVTQLRSKPALLAWLLGNEIGSAVLQSRGDAPLVAGLRDLYTAVKAADPHHPVSHANWPPARHLDLTFLDFVSFNVYPLWPPEVVAMGFGRYIEMVLRPIAGDQPLLISEFGANTIEAGAEGQSRLLRDSWRGLIRAGAVGGLVFEFADECGRTTTTLLDRATGGRECRRRKMSCVRMKILRRHTGSCGPIGLQSRPCKSSDACSWKTTSARELARLGPSRSLPSC